MSHGHGTYDATGTYDSEILHRAPPPPPPPKSLAAELDLQDLSGTSQQRRRPASASAAHRKAPLRPEQRLAVTTVSNQMRLSIAERVEPNLQHSRRQNQKLCCARSSCTKKEAAEWW